MTPDKFINSRRKGQFFIITTILIAIVFFSISSLLHSYADKDFENLETDSSSFIAQNIELMVRENFENISSSKLDSIQEETARFLGQVYTDRGYEVTLNTSSSSECVNMSLTSSDHKIKKSICKTGPVTVVSWNRDEEGDDLSDFENIMTKEVFNSMCEWENNADKIRWSEAGSACEGGEAMMRWSKEVEANNNGKATLRLKFTGRSFENSGVSFWVEDSGGNKYPIKCDEDSETPDGFTCNQQDIGGTFTWDGNYTINAGSEIEKFYIASEMDDCCFDGGDDSNLYHFTLKVE